MKSTGHLVCCPTCWIIWVLRRVSQFNDHGRPSPSLIGNESISSLPACRTMFSATNTLPGRWESAVTKYPVIKCKNFYALRQRKFSRLIPFFYTSPDHFLFNSTATLFVSNSQIYGYCPSWALSWEYRKKGILDEIRQYAADIICLQEVETDQFYHFFLPELKQDGYDGEKYVLFSNFGLSMFATNAD